MKYRIEQDNLRGTGLQGYSEVVEVRAVLDSNTVRDELEYAELFLHEVIESINLAVILQEEILKHSTIESLAKELAKILLATGWKPTKIPPEGLVIE